MEKRLAGWLAGKAAPALNPHILAVESAAFRPVRGEGGTSAAEQTINIGRTGTGRGRSWVTSTWVGVNRSVRARLQRGAVARRSVCRSSGRAIPDLRVARLLSARPAALP